VNGPLVVAAVVLDGSWAACARDRNGRRRLRRQAGRLSGYGVHLVLVGPQSARVAVGWSSPGGLGLRVLASADGRVLEVGDDERRDLRSSLHSGSTVGEWLGERGIGPGLVLLVRAPGRSTEPPDDRRAAELLGPGSRRAAVVALDDVRPATGEPVLTLADLLGQQVRVHEDRRVPDIDLDPAWTLLETGRDPMRHRVTETLLSVGTGGVAARGAVEEHHEGGNPLVLAAGVYERTGPDSRLLAGPLCTRLDVVDPPEEDRRVLDLRTGVLVRQEVGEPSRPLRTMRFASIDIPGAFVVRAEGGEGRLSAGEPLRPSPGTAMETGRRGGLAWARARGVTGGLGAAAWQEERTAGGTCSVDRIAAYVRGVGRQPVLGRALRSVRDAEGRGLPSLLVAQRAGWARRWHEVNVDLPGDPVAERALRFALFQLRSNAGRGPESAVGARGISGQAYAGHVFWDADAFILPAMVTIDPPTAEAMVRYRTRRLDAARAFARASGRDGARFPWESAATGVDVTPPTARVGAEVLDITTGQREEHVTADVAWGAVRVAEWTGSATARSAAATLLDATARYWASRCHTDPDGTSHIRDVMGPDEYHDRVDDNAFTNVMARWNLRTAAGADRRGTAPDGADRWRRLADTLVDGLDDASLVYEQFRGYDALRPLLASDVGGPPVAADLVLGREGVARSQVIKQPDVLMLHQMVPFEVVPGSLGPNLDRYGPRTAHGSSLSPAVTASLLARAGRLEEALELLHLALALDIEDLTGTTAGGLHVATLAGSWMAVLEGFLGVRVDGGVLRVRPRLPETWRDLEVRFHCLGRTVQVEVGPRHVTVRTSRPLRVRLGDHPTVRVDGSARLDRDDPTTGDVHA
jgi:trehalose/maltose hydrolase-like predicted phosphorylase